VLEVNLKGLVGRMNSTCTEALREAAHLCLSRTHYDVEIEHVLLALLKREDTDLVPIFRQWDLSRADVAADVEKTMRSISTGNTSTPRFSPHLTRWLQSAWMIASVEYGALAIRSAHLLVALLADDDFSYRARDLSPRLKEVKVQDLKDLLERLVQSSPENVGYAPTPVAPKAGAAAGAARTAAAASATASAGTASSGAAVAATGDTKMLDQFSIDLTAEARAGRIDPIIGRDGEIRKMVDILLRRRKNNPIVVGEAGVGKTAVVEGLARRIALGDVPDPLKNVTIRTLDLTLLQAGAGVRGEFENRLKEVIKEIKSSPTPIILFIDEAHTLIGAGASAGQGDAANLLKPALARGELRTIAATTYAEYKKYFEKDAALERRFQPIHVPEPDVDTAILMMRAVADRFEAHHGVRILDEAVRAAVKLSDRYISGRYLPDKAVDLLDTSCARVALARATLPEPLEERQRRLENLDREIVVLERETAVGDAQHDAPLEELRARKQKTAAELKDLQERYKKAKETMDRILPARLVMEARVAGKEPPEDVPADLLAMDTASLKREIESRKKDLAQIQGENALMAVCVDAETIAQVISAWTGIPAGRMVSDEIAAVQRLKDELEKRVVGQSLALEELAKRIQTSRAGLEDPNKPIGVFLMTGPSGVGKTETALALAEILYGGEKNLISINMSEYQEAHSVSGLKGSPKGYVGYGEGGALTEPVRQRPYSVVLLDEVEKAHKDVMELFYQVFDKGMLEDTTGRMVNFRNTVIILTSNLGGDQVIQATLKNDGNVPGAEALRDLVMPHLRRHFPAAFLGRVIVLPFAPLPDEVMQKIARLKLNRVVTRVKEQHNISLTYDDSVVDAIVDRCVEVESGARNVDHIVTNTVLPELGRRILGWMVDGALPPSLRVTVGPDSNFYYLREGEQPPAVAVAREYVEAAQAGDGRDKEKTGGAEWTGASAPGLKPPIAET
jgi:type VI secretion system protein VasG